MSAVRRIVFALTLFGCTHAVPQATPTLSPLLTTADLPSLAAPPPDQRLPYGPAPQQFGNLRLPKGAGPHPVVVFIHGGCWLSEFDLSYVGSLEQAFAEAGFAVWSLEYRRVGDEGGGWPGSFLDIARGTEALRALAPRFDLDLKRVIASGHSAGGAFALWLAARAKIPPSSELHSANPLPIRGVLGLAPAPDLEGLERSGVCGGVVSELLGGSAAKRPERYAAASPMELAPIGVPQIIVLGALDAAWGPVGQSYVARARIAGDARIEVVKAPEAGHFELVAPRSSTWPLVMDALNRLAALTR